MLDHLYAMQSDEARVTMTLFDTTLDNPKFAISQFKVPDYGDIARPRTITEARDANENGPGRGGL